MADGSVWTTADDGSKEEGGSVLANARVLDVHLPCSSARKSLTVPVSVEKFTPIL